MRSAFSCFPEFRQSQSLSCFATAFVDTEAKKIVAKNRRVIPGALPPCVAGYLGCVTAVRFLRHFPRRVQAYPCATDEV